MHLSAQLATRARTGLCKFRGGARTSSTHNAGVRKEKKLGMKNYV